ncbi:glycosyl hydrolase [Ekhidna sp.]
MYRSLFFAACITLAISSHSQIVPVGDGSYTRTFPGVDQAGRNGFPSGTPQISGTVSDKPVPTNDWWSKLIKENHADNLYNYPFSMKTQSEGLVVNYIPWGVQGDAQAIIVGTSGLSETNATVADYSDWTVTMDWGTKFQATSGIGMPFLYFEKQAGQTASVQINQGTVSVNNEMITVSGSGNGANYIIYAPIGSTWTENGEVYTSTLNGQNYWSLVMLPQGATNVSTLASEYQKYAYVFPSNTTVNWTYNEATSMLRTDFTVSTDVKEGVDNTVLMGLLPHQWRHLSSDSPTPQEETYSSVRGELKMLAGNSFSTEYSFHGILPTLPYLSNYSDGFDLSALYDKVELIQNDQLATWTDSYNEGQVMNRLIQTARIAHKMGMTEARDKMIATVRERLEDWLTAEPGEVAFLYYYNDDWTAMLGYPAGHGQDNNINDHHFHWGYFIHAGAFMEQFDPGWAEEWGPMIDLLVRDAASPNRDDELFPFLRNFSPYGGHCWANGFASFPQGNDQESTSESMQFNSSLIHWGSITGNDEIRDLGIYLYTTEQAAVEEYWFDIHEEIFPENQYSLVSRVWGNSYDNGTFWTSDIEASYGIELYPIHGGSMYLGHPLDYAEKLWAEIEANTGILSNDDNVNLWHDVMYQYLSFIDPQKAIQLYDSYPDRNLKFGVSDAQTYYWIHAMNAIGKVDATVTADHPIAVAFKQGEDYTYVAHNYSDVSVDVNFSTGYTLTVPANSMATNRDSDISGTISTSFESAYPGGSVELEVTVAGGTPSKVEFYDDGVLLGESLNEPFVFSAGDLASRVHGFYAKIYDGEAFGVTNVASVVVGEQLPYNDIVHAIPGIIESAHYDYYEGGNGQGIAYSDVSPGNNGEFRSGESVDATEVDGEGATVGWISAGEWLEYSINVNQSGVYDLAVRYASGNAAGGGPFYLEINGNPVSENVPVPSTGNWNTWNTLTTSGVELVEGNHILRVVFDNGEFNLGKMNFTRTGDLSYGPPIADAGDNINVILPATSTTFDASESSDPDNDVLSFQWVQIYGPSVAEFSDDQISNPVVSNLADGVYKFELTVSDGEYASIDDLLVIVSETGNSNPNANITSPLNNSAFREGEDILIEATASDLDGTITKIAFYEGETLLGEDTDAPFSYLWSGAEVGDYSLSAVATDNAGGTGTSEVVAVSVEEVLSCSETSNESLEGVFNVGYTATFESVGNNVTVTFELLDTDKTGIVAFLWNQDPFSEVQMDFVEGTTFSKTLSSLTPGEQISVACKFAYAGGLSVTKYIQYTVGSDCSGGGGDDTEAPTNFTATIGDVDSRTIELVLNANDNSGTIIYEVNYNSETVPTTGSSGSSKSLVINNLNPNTSYEFSVVAKDLSGNVASNSPILLNASTTEDTNSSCSGTDTEAQQGNFSVGYNYWFETDGTNVTMTFELLDEKDGVVAYLWRQNSFAEFSMTHVEGRTFTRTISDQTPGATIAYACKFAFAGGLAVTKYFDYVVGDNCSEDEDTTAPTNFTAITGAITPSSIELLLNATDNSGDVIYKITYSGGSETVTASSGIEESVIIDGLNPDTEYSFTVTAVDPSNNEAANSPLTVEETTLDSDDTTAPTNFTAQKEAITNTSIVFELNAEDDSGEVIFHVTYDDEEESITSASGEVKTLIIDGLTANTNYSFTISAKDASGNEAANSPLTIDATTLESEDNSSPTNFTALVGEITTTTIELQLHAIDDSGEVYYEVSYADKEENVTYASGEEKSMIIDELTPNTNYSFTISAKDASGNEAEDSPFSISATTDAVVLGTETESITVYPNPVRTSLTIEWTDFLSGTIYSLAGEKMLESTQKSISIENMQAGIYILELKGVNDQLVRLKIVKE